MKKRRLAAIMFTDIVGYTALMGSDEDRAFEVLAKNREIHTKLIQQYNGTLIKEMGDGMLISFDLASEAVRCAIEIQKACKEQDIPLKIGIHEGEMVFEGSDVLGDGVNIASRIQDDTDGGCIMISGSVYRDIKNKADISTEFIEEKYFKNVDEKIKVYKILSEVEPNQQQAENSNGGKKRLNKKYYYLIGLILVALAILFIWKAIPSKEINEIEKSIAVLPFKSLSDDPEKQYLADGVMDAITSHLAKIRELRVIARTSIEQYRDQSKDVRDIGKDLNVNFLLEGSFQMLGDEARLIVQLISTKDGSHVWSDEYDREWKDIFNVQSDVAKEIANEIKVIISPVEKQNIESIPTTDLTAYDFYLKGKEYGSRSWDEQDYRYAIQMYEKAIEIDPNFALAWIGLAENSRFIYWTYYDRSEEQILKTKQYLDKALKLSPQSREVLFEQGKYHYHCKLDYPKALQIFEKLKSEYPNDEKIYAWIGNIHRRMGEFTKALEYYYKAISLNPSNWTYPQYVGQTLRVLSEYNDAEKYLKKVIDLNPSFYAPYWNVLYLYTVTGDIKKAKEFIQKNQEFISQPPIVLNRAYIEILDGDYEKAIQITASLNDDVINADHYYYCSKHLQMGLIYYMMSNEKMAVKHFEKERILLEEKIKAFKNDHRIYSSLGITYAGLGNKLKAIEAGRKAIEILDFDKDAYSGFYPEMDMARILMMVGEYDEALLRLEYILSRDGTLTVELLKIDPFWDPVREMDGFKTIINNPEYQVNITKN